MQDNRRQCSWALSWDSYRAWVCEAVQTIAREQAGIWGRNLNSPPFLGRPVRYAVLGPGHLWISAQLGDRASPVRTPPRILLPPLETWACHAKALPYRPLLQVRGETQKEAKELKKANSLSFLNSLEHKTVQGGYWPRPLEATSVAMRIGAFPNLNSAKIEKMCSEYFKGSTAHNNQCNIM